VKRIAIIGGGAGGLAAAYDLCRAGCQVTVYEASETVGGLSSGFKCDHWDWSVEKYYHHWFQSDRYILGLIDELGYRDQVLFPKPITAAYHEGDFYPLDAPLSYTFKNSPWVDQLPGSGTFARGFYAFKYPGLGLVDTLRYGVAGMALLLLPDWRPLEAFTAHQWLRRWMGERTYRALWEPLLIGKFGDHYQEVNAAWFWARVKARTPRLGTFIGGFQAFLDLLAERVRQVGGEIQLNSPIHAITTTPNGGVQLSGDRSEEGYDQCLTTTSPALLAKMAPELPDPYLERLLSLKSMGSVVLVLSLRHRLSEAGVYWHNLPKVAGFPFLSLVEHTNFLSPDFFGGEHIVYCGDYLDPDHEYFSLSKSQLLERFLPALKRFNPAFETDWLIDSWLFRTGYAQPIPPVNHSASIPDLKTPLPGLWFASMSQVYPWDRGTNFAVKVARKAAQRMLLEGSEL
jgi:protoporphyrinogen oxidase